MSGTVIQVKNEYQYNRKGPLRWVQISELPIPVVGILTAAAGQGIPGIR